MWNREGIRRLAQRLRGESRHLIRYLLIRETRFSARNISRKNCQRQLEDGSPNFGYILEKIRSKEGRVAFQRNSYRPKRSVRRRGRSSPTAGAASRSYSPSLLISVPTSSPLMARLRLSRESLQTTTGSLWLRQVVMAVSSMTPRRRSRKVL